MMPPLVERVGTRKRVAPKERVFSFRSANHGWDPKNQRPELWSLYNTRVKAGESIRVFPLSNWTELDVSGSTSVAESIDIVPLYFSDERPVVNRDGQWIMVDDDRMPLQPGETPQKKTGPIPDTGLLPPNRGHRVRCAESGGHRCRDVCGANVGTTRSINRSR